MCQAVNRWLPELNSGRNALGYIDSDHKAVRSRWSSHHALSHASVWPLRTARSTSGLRHSAEGTTADRSAHHGKTRFTNRNACVSISRFMSALYRPPPVRSRQKRPPDLDRFMPIPARMLFPDERIAGDAVERVVVLDAQRPELDMLALQRRLRVE